MNKTITIDDCKIIKLPKIENYKGNLTPVHANDQIPFKTERIYYLYDIPGGSVRGGHAHRGLEQFIVSASGSFDVILDDGLNKKTVRLNHSYSGLYMPRLIWREIINFSTGAICLVLASHYYDEADYFREYNEFVKFKFDKIV